MSYSEKVLGFGSRGIVITKPFECEDKNKTRKSKSLSDNSKSRSNSRSKISSLARKKDTIVKISIGDGAIREYTFMKQLPQGKKYPYAQIKNIDLCKVKVGPTTMNHLKRLAIIKKEINESWIDEFIIEQDNIWQIFMPRLGSRSLYSILRKKQMPSDRRNLYDTDERYEAKSKFMTVKQLENILHHFSKLLPIFIELNGKSLYHNDLKSNNIMCDVDKKGNISKMWLIDFDNSYSWNGNDTAIKGLWEYDYKFGDVCDLMFLLVREVLLIACSNKPIYDELFQCILDIDIFSIETKRKIMDSQWKNINFDTTELLGKIRAKVEIMEEPSWNEYIDVVVTGRKVPIKTQREKARNYNENNIMGTEDHRLK